MILHFVFFNLHFAIRSMASAGASGTESSKLVEGISGFRYYTAKPERFLFPAGDLVQGFGWGNGLGVKKTMDDGGLAAC